MSASRPSEHNAQGAVMHSPIFHTGPTESEFIQGDMMFQDLATTQFGSNTLFKDPRNVQEWAASSANGQASTMNVYATQHVNPREISNGMPGSFAYDSVSSTQDCYIPEAHYQETRRRTALPGIDNPMFGHLSPHVVEFSTGTSMYEDVLSDAPSLDWGLSMSANSSADDCQSNTLQLDFTPTMEPFINAELFDDSGSSNFQLDQADVISNPEILASTASLCSPSTDSAVFTSDISPVILPMTGSAESSCTIGGTILPYEQQPYGSEFTSQLLAGRPAFAPDASCMLSDISTSIHDQSSDIVDVSMSSGFPYSATPVSNAFMPRRWSGDGEVAGARSSHLYHVSAGSDGLFHCPFENSAEGCTHRPDKLKCNYDKHLDSHLKPYRCNEPDPECAGKQFSSTACLLRHQRERHAMHGHGDRPFMCQYPGCDRALQGNGFPRHWNLNDHMKRVHNFVVEGSSKTHKGRKGADLAPASRTRIQKRTKASS